jgi:hypothetical protein
MHHEMQRQGRTIHGDVYSPEWRAWCTMRRRCNDPNIWNYKNYGGRGITVCERWLTYANFLADMGRRPTPKHTIDRIDNDTGYSPDNCRWATAVEQQRNNRRTHFLTYNGQTHCIRDWAKIVGLTEDAIGCRIHRGWSVEDTLTRPLMKGRLRGPSNTSATRG